jgi:hypothetical protein
MNDDEVTAPEAAAKMRDRRQRASLDCVVRRCDPAGL